MLDQLLHVIVPVAFLLPVAYDPVSLWPWLLSCFLLAVYREDAQHRPEEGWQWVIGGGGRWVDVAFGTLAGVPLWVLAFYINVID